MMIPPPSCLAVLGALAYYGGWVNTTEILRRVGTTCIHKRLSQLIKMGLVEKSWSLGGRRIYRVIPGVKIKAEIVGQEAAS